MLGGRPVSVYYSDEMVTLHLGRAEDVLPSIELPPVDVVIADPPYGETALPWDRWPTDWPQLVRPLLAAGGSMWCFGSMRMFLGRVGDFAGWRFAQDVVFEKHNGSSFLADRFRRVHEHATHWYLGSWAEVYKLPQTTLDATAKVVCRKAKPAQWQGVIGEGRYVSEDGGPRLMRSVIQVRSMHGRAENETQKPLGAIDPLLRYSCPPRGLVLDPFAGAGSVLVAAKALGLRAVGVELREGQCEAAARRLAHGVLSEAEGSA